MDTLNDEKHAVGRSELSVGLERLPCPFCGKTEALEMIAGRELMDYEQEFWPHAESWAVICSAETPKGKGGCGAMGGFALSEDLALEKWNMRSNVK